MVMAATQTQITFPVAIPREVARQVWEPMMFETYRCEHRFGEHDGDCHHIRFQQMVLVVILSCGTQYWRGLQQ